jgi:hypothetical protein
MRKVQGGTSSDSKYLCTKPQGTLKFPLSDFPVKTATLASVLHARFDFSHTSRTLTKHVTRVIPQINYCAEKEQSSPQLKHLVALGTNRCVGSRTIGTTGTNNSTRYSKKEKPQ